MSDEAALRKKTAFVKRCRDDFEFFARTCLRVKDKDPEKGMTPFVFNTAQRFLHKKIEEQRSRTGKIRALVLKGRQQGISTYVEGRYYWRASLNKYINCYILSHEQSATDNLFDMVDRYHRHNPLAPSTGTANVRTLEFDRLEGQYVVATAGSRAGGRSRTTTLFHGSEVAFWPYAEDHFAASVQTVPNSPSTEIILETTSAGPSGAFYERWQNAEAGIGEYIAVFIPWFWSPEYAEPVPQGFVLSSEKDETGVSEEDYATFYELTNEQMAWRRNKIAEMGGRKFRKDYPATPAEAFESADASSFIESAPVLRARKRKDIVGYGPLILGADPAGPGGDRFAVAARRGAKVEWVKYRDKVDTVAAAHWLRDLVLEHKPHRLYVDAGGIGHAVVSMLKTFEADVSKVVEGVNFGGTSQHKLAKPQVPGPKLRRDEMWLRIRDWLALEEGVSLPDMDALQADLTGVRVKPGVDNNLKLESKDDMRKRGIRSPDLGDAVALTFASVLYVPVSAAPSQEPKQFTDDVVVKTGSSFMSGNPHGWMA